MMSVDECRRLLDRPDLSDDEIAEFLRDLDAFLRHYLDEYFRDALADGE